MRNAAVVLSLAFASSTLAGGAGGGPRYSQAYGQTFAEVGNPGNADYTYELFPGGPTRSVGGVNHRYRIAVTEVTNAQWAEFANAIAPHLNGLGGYGSDFVPTIAIDGLDPQGNPRFSVVPGAEQFPARMGWRWAARYCNWLHNDKALTLDAFQSGAYDATTFGPGDGAPGSPTYTDQSTRSDGARFWIPSEDEWVKAAYYDPNRFGEGQGGYWRYPGMSDDPLITAPADLGGETNAGGFWYGGENSGELPFDVGQFPNAASYYGVLDISGGEGEFTETWSNDDNRERRALGSDYFLDAKLIPEFDDIEPWVLGATPPDVGFTGFRLAMVIPSPGLMTLAPVVLGRYFQRRSR